MRMQVDQTIDQMVNRLSAIVGEFVWLVECADDRILRLDFGKPHLTVHEPKKIAHASQTVQDVIGRRIVRPTGDWHLFIYDGIWNVQAGRFNCSRFDDLSTIEKCLNYLDGQKLTSVDYIESDENLILKFDLGGKLSICPSREDPDSAEWIIFQEDGSNLSYMSSNRIVLEK